MQHHADGGRFVDYAELPNALETRIAPHFGIPVSGSMDAVLAWHAKNPVLPFRPDGQTKRAEATESLRAAVENICGSSYRRFDQMRRAELASEMPR
jgi:hypothetical protein